MPDDVVTLDTDGLARLDQVLLGLLPDHALPAAHTFLDEEGTPIATREAGRVVGLRPLPWERPEQVRAGGARPVVVPAAERLPAEAVPAGALVLLAAGGVRPDNARHPAWIQAWTQAAERGGATVVLVPASPADVATSAPTLAAAYSSGPLLDLPTVAQPAGAGRTLFFTGLSGSGKSTVARAVVDRLAGTRTITLLDGDVVRTHLSKGLGFSQQDRDINIRRIGWVAAEVTKHGGLAVCAPIAPYDETRRWVRQTVESAGGPGSFLLIWISTPLEVCEQRDVKGLYAKARAGEIRGFTGIDDPYEPPPDADLVIDTSQVALDDAVAQVLALLSP
ncbi:MAG TPA: adenylyl-sulfate kinase [Mycobacteriales bacterium]|nr:adenylyl-sulfate kinase [Mycobacteriales bacterium]